VTVLRSAQLTAIALLALLNGCGFALRGSLPQSTQMPQISVLSAEHDALHRALSAALSAAGAELVETPTDSDALVLTLAPEQLARRAVSVNSRARAAQYELSLSSELSLQQGETLLLNMEPVSVQSEYFEEIENLVGTQDEIRLLTEEMRSRLVQQIIRRVSAALP
jgi:LPS-assembly lipoprotein